MAPNGPLPGEVEKLHSWRDEENARHVLYKLKKESIAPRPKMVPEESAAQAASSAEVPPSEDKPSSMLPPPGVSVYRVSDTVSLTRHESEESDTKSEALGQVSASETGRMPAQASPDDLSTANVIGTGAHLTTPLCGALQSGESNSDMKDTMILGYKMPEKGVSKTCRGSGVMVSALAFGLMLTLVCGLRHVLLIQQKEDSSLQRAVQALHKSQKRDEFLQHRASLQNAAWAQVASSLRQKLLTAQKSGEEELEVQRRQFKTLQDKENGLDRTRAEAYQELKHTQTDLTKARLSLWTKEKELSEMHLEASKNLATASWYKDESARLKSHSEELAAAIGKVTKEEQQEVSQRRAAQGQTALLQRELQKSQKTGEKELAVQQRQFKDLQHTENELNKTRAEADLAEHEWKSTRSALNNARLSLKAKDKKLLEMRSKESEDPARHFGTKTSLRD